MRRAQSGHRIGPLFADSELAAELIFVELCTATLKTTCPTAATDDETYFVAVGNAAARRQEVVDADDAAAAGAACGSSSTAGAVLVAPDSAHAGMIAIDVPDDNAAAVALAHRYAMRAVFETARMYTNGPPPAGCSAWSLDGPQQRTATATSAPAKLPSSKVAKASAAPTLTHYAAPATSREQHHHPHRIFGISTLELG